LPDSLPDITALPPRPYTQFRCDFSQFRVSQSKSARPFADPEREKSYDLQGPVNPDRAHLLKRDESLLRNLAGSTIKPHAFAKQVAMRD
jgi:hypothetical protein